MLGSAYALASHPVAQLILAADEHGGHKTKGAKAVFAVALMFLMLCGGVWMLLQSSFGPKIAYYITGTAFWGCWFVLSILWFTGVPGLKIGPLNIPRSTPQYYGPTGRESEWVPLTGPVLQRHPLPEQKLTEAPPLGDITDPAIQTDLTAATTAAGTEIASFYASKLGVAQDKILIPGIVRIDTMSIVSDGGLRWVRVTTKAGAALATDGEDTKALIERVKTVAAPHFDVYKDRGSKALETLIAMPLTLGLFLLHAVLLGLAEVKKRPTPAGAPEPVRTSA